MGNLYVILLEHIDFLIGEPNSMNGKKIFVKDAKIPKMGYRRNALCLLHIFYLGLCLCNVHMNADIIFISKLLCSHHKLIRVVEKRS